MTQTTFTDNVVIQGSRDIDQLKIQGNAAQAQPLQTWENSSSGVLSQVTGDGRLQVGDDVGLSSPDALVEAHRAETSTAKPKRGWHSLGKVTNLVSDVITWTMSELLLLGSAGVSGLQTAFRAKLTHNNSGSSTSAELRAGDFQSINQTGSIGTRVGQVTGVRGTGSNDVNAYLAKAVGVEASITNASGGDVTDAIGVDVAAPTNSGTIANLYGVRVPDLTQGTINYAIKTGQGIVSFGDYMEVKRPASVPGTPSTDIVRVYPKSNGKVYAKNWSGTEYDLTGGGSFIFHGRLSLASNDPVPASVTGATNIYLVPMSGNIITLPDGSGGWEYLTLATDPLSVPASVNQDYDIFAYNNAGALALETVAWNAANTGAINSIDTANPRNVAVTSHTLTTGDLIAITGNSNSANNGLWQVGTTTSTSFQILNPNGANPGVASPSGSGGTWQRADQNRTRSTAITYENGVYVKDSATTHLYIGSVRTAYVSGTTEDSPSRRLLWNYFNRYKRILYAKEPATSWTYTTAAWRAANKNRQTCFDLIQGVADWPVFAMAQMAGVTSSQSFFTGVGINASSANNYIIGNGGPGGATTGHQAFYDDIPTVGYSYFQVVEWGGTGVTRYGDNNTPDRYQGGIMGEIRA